ncbi:MAG: 2-hydroxyacyl-CoA dehydratase [Deltaproteobacteria bacterium]|nr:2-hydroxyacyl-CoA dehydratase [Deltaproteobacteria bacterium]
MSLIKLQHHERSQQIARLFTELRRHKIPKKTLANKIAADLSLNPTAATSSPLSLIASELRRAYTPDAFVVWRNITVPPELLNAFSSLVFFPVEAIGSLFAAQGAEQCLLIAADKIGIPRSVCNFVRTIPASQYLNICASPDFIINTAKGCEGISNVYSFAAHHYQAPHYLINVPYNAGDNINAIKYVASQLYELTHLIEKQTGETLSSANLHNSLAYAHNAYTAFKAALHLRSRYPLLDPPSVFQSLTIGVSPYYGKPEFTAFAQHMLQSYQERLQNDDQVKQQPQRRLMWMFLMPYYPNDIVEYIERDGLIRFVWEDISELNFKGCDLYDPYDDLAKHLLNSRESILPQQRFKLLLEQAEEHRIDGVVMLAMPHCGVYAMQYPLLQQLFLREQIPVLTLDACCIDSHSFNPSQVRTRIDAFSEMLLNKPLRWQ